MLNIGSMVEVGVQEVTSLTDGYIRIYFARTPIFSAKYATIWYDNHASD
jgi:hypothetical protein